MAQHMWRDRHSGQLTPLAQAIPYLMVLVRAFCMV
jgi:hypothetical protein